MNTKLYSRTNRMLNVLITSYEAKLHSASIFDKFV